jgi:asparagine synthase (glutamine-hydrolysing)
VCQSAGLDWQWNWRALAAVSCFEHVLGNDSLHPLVSRLGAGEIVTVRGGSLDLRVAPPPEVERFADPAGAAMDALMYLRERVRNFIANGLALVGAFARPRTPFVTTEWISAIRQTPRRMKLGNAWHRSTIAKLEPSLLAFPVDDALRPMGRRAELNYWTGRVGHTKDTPAMDYAALFAAASFEAAIDHAINRLDDVVDRDAAGRFLESASRQERTRTLSYLMALGTFKELLAQP